MNNTVKIYRVTTKKSPYPKYIGTQWSLYPAISSHRFIEHDDGYNTYILPEGYIYYESNSSCKCGYRKILDLSEKTSHVRLTDVGGCPALVVRDNGNYTIIALDRAEGL